MKIVLTESLRMIKLISPQMLHVTWIKTLTFKVNVIVSFLYGKKKTN